MELQGETSEQTSHQELPMLTVKGGVEMYRRAVLMSQRWCFRTSSQPTELHIARWYKDHNAGE